MELMRAIRNYLEYQMWNACHRYAWHTTSCLTKSEQRLRNLNK